MVCFLRAGHIYVYIYIYDLLHGSACNMTRYFTSSDSIVTSRRRVEIQSTSGMSPYFTMTKCNKLFITYLTRSTERLPSLPSSISTISTISMTVVMTALFKKRELRQYACSVCSVYLGERSEPHTGVFNRDFA